MKKYILIHTQGNIETAHAYYENMQSVNEVLYRLMDEEIEKETDSFKVYEIEVGQIEEEYGENIENLDMYDVAYNGKIIKRYGVVTHWGWEADEAIEIYNRVVE